MYQRFGLGFLDGIGQELRYAARQVRKNPGFAVTGVLTLALGIGANTTIFTVVRAVLLKPLEYRDPDRIVRVSGGATLEHFEELKTGKSFSDVGAFAVAMENITLSGGGQPEVLKEARVSFNFLRILGVEPVVGRSFLPEEDAPGGPAVAMISTALWKRRFGGDPSIAGKTAMLAAAPYTIVGVLPAGFEFPFSGADVWVTRPVELVPPKSRRLSPILSVFARLKPNVDLQRASAELVVLNHEYAAGHPEWLDAKRHADEPVKPLKDEMVSNVRSKLWMLFGAVGFVLLIACANVASLLLARTASRSREFAVRAAIGAGRGRLIGQLLTESALLAFAGGALGIALAKWSLSGLSKMSALDLPRAGEIRLDSLVLGFAVALSTITGLLFGLAPSLGASRPDLAGVLRATGEAASTAGARRLPRWLSGRGVLVMGQVALSVILLIGATLLMESVARLRGVDPGFQAANVLTMRIALPATRYDTDQKKASFFDELVTRVESIHGVRSAAVTLTLPMTGWMGSPIQVAERAPVKFNERPIGVIEAVTPGYFRTLHIALKRGREFTERDNARATPVAMINESLARRFWPAYPRGQDPVGRHLLIGINPQAAEIVGIVADVREDGLDSEPRPGVYRPDNQSPLQSAMFAVQASGNPLRLVNAVRGQVLAIDRDQPISEVKTMEDIVDASEGQRRLMTTLLSFFAGAAVLLAMIGLYGVIAYSVVQRTKEMGIRRALGAQGSDILSLVIGHGLGLTVVGVGIGIAGAFALTRVMKSLLFQVSSTDPVTFAGVAVLFVLVALAASYVPARRATRIDPMAALRTG